MQTTGPTPTMPLRVLFLLVVILLPLPLLLPALLLKEVLRRRRARWRRRKLLRPLLPAHRQLSPGRLLLLRRLLANRILGMK